MGLSRDNDDFSEKAAADDEFYEKFSWPIGRSAASRP